MWFINILKIDDNCLKLKSNNKIILKIEKHL